MFRSSLLDEEVLDALCEALPECIIEIRMYGWVYARTTTSNSADAMKKLRERSVSKLGKKWSLPHGPL